MPLTLSRRRPYLLFLGCAVAACLHQDPEPETPAPKAATHSGLLSIQEASLPGLPQAGRGLNVRLEFSGAARKPDVEMLDGALGCRAWLYDMKNDPPPAPSGDEGTIHISGTNEEISAPCVHVDGQGYVCPVVEWDLAGASIIPLENGLAALEVPSAHFTEQLSHGRYVWLHGSSLKNSGRFPILAHRSRTSLVIQAPGAVEDRGCTGSIAILAGAGPVPNNTRDSIAGGEEVTVSLEARAGGNFEFPPLQVSAGHEFEPDEATVQLLRTFPVGGGAVTFGCAGGCAEPTISALSIATTDADVSGLSPAALPTPIRKQVSVLCAVESVDGSLVVPREVMELLESAHAESPITRIRTAFMRGGFALAKNPAGSPANPVTLLVGHQKLGFTTVQK